MNLYTNPRSLTPVEKRMLTDLSLLIEQARKNDKWIYTVYQSCWFTPDDLEKANKEGRFIWHVSNFRLRDPREQLKELNDRIGFAVQEYNEFQLRIAEWQSKSK